MQANLEYPEDRPLLTRNNLVRKEKNRRFRTSTICVTSKAAILILVWSFVVTTMYQLGYQPSNGQLNPSKSTKDKNIIISFYAFTAILYSFYPLAGFLADTRFGRYKTITRSLNILLIIGTIAFALLCLFLTFTIIKSEFNLHTIGIYGAVSVYLLIFITGFISFNANAIQFGMDQLYDSPADHQSLFIHWYMWINNFSLLLTQVPWLLHSNYYIPFAILLQLYAVATLTILSVSLVVAFRNKHWFIIDTARVNPYKLVYKISKFASQLKVPLHRSAFTYCEDELPTGLDLGKTKYGGPYTTEEVEDVKTFFGILKILFSLGPTYFLYMASDRWLQWYIKHLYFVPHIEIGNNTTNYSNHTIFEAQNKVKSLLLQGDIFSRVVIVILLPLYLCTLHSCLYRYIPSMMRRIGIGIFFLVASLISMLVLDTIAHYHHRSSHDCMFNLHLIPDSVFEDITLIIIPRFFSALSNMFFYIALYEFICAQSPHSMKGFLIGLSFAIKGLFQTIAAFMVFPFSYVTSSFPSCGMYYYIMNISVGILALLIYVIVARGYKYRKRDDICNIYRYAEEYYSNIQNK